MLYNRNNKQHKLLQVGYRLIFFVLNYICAKILKKDIIKCYFNRATTRANRIMTTSADEIFTIDCDAITGIKMIYRDSLMEHILEIMKTQQIVKSICALVAVKNGHFECLKYFCANRDKYEITDELFYETSRKNDLKMFSYLCEKLRYMRVRKHIYSQCIKLNNNKQIINILRKMDFLIE